MKPQKEGPGSIISDNEFWKSLLDSLDEASVMKRHSPSTKSLLDSLDEASQSINTIDSSGFLPDRSLAAAEQLRESENNGKELVVSEATSVLSPIKGSVPALPTPMSITGGLDPHMRNANPENWILCLDDNPGQVNELMIPGGGLPDQLASNVHERMGAGLCYGQLQGYCQNCLDQQELLCSLIGEMPTKYCIEDQQGPSSSSWIVFLDDDMWNANPENWIPCLDDNIMESMIVNSSGEIDNPGQVNELMIPGGGLPDQLAGNVDERMDGGLCCGQLQGYCQNCLDQQEPSSSSWSRLDQLNESRPMNAVRREAAVSLLLHQRSGPVDRNNTDISYSKLSNYFSMPITQAARELKVGLTVFKKKCREFGIPRWPHRKIKSLENLIHNVQELADSNGALRQARLSNAMQILEEQKKLMEESPGTELDEKTKRLRQACFKEKHKKRRQMM